MALMETEYLMLRRYSEEEVERYMALVLNWPVKVVESDPAWRHQAATIKAAGRLSLANAWIAGLALSLGASLVHKDPEFDRFDGLQPVRLPS
jgi:predicted nucleic acid-binding protein